MDANLEEWAKRGATIKEQLRDEPIVDSYRILGNG
jgi:hypothetical protein